MGRPPRGFAAGQIYHVIGRGNDGQDLFLDDWHFQRFLSILSGAKTRFKFELFAYCLMTNHFHLLIRQGSQSLSQAIHSILNRYAHWFNAKHEKRGHLFQDRFRALPCRSDPYFVELLRYIHLNPVRAGLVAQPDDWPWTGHRQIMRAGSPVDREFPLSFFGERLDVAIQEYRRFLEKESDFTPDPEESDEAPEQVLIPEAPVISEIRPTPAQLALDVSRRLNISLEALRGSGRNRRLTCARSELVYLCLNAGLRPGEIQQYLGCSPAYISKVAGLAFS